MSNDKVLRDRFFRILFVMRSFPGALLGGNFLVIFWISPGEIGFADSDIGSEANRNCKISIIVSFSGSVHEWGWNVSANWEAKMLALSLSVIANWPFSCRRGGIFSLYLVSLFVDFQRKQLFDCTDFIYNWNCSDLWICSLYFKRFVKKFKFFL
jgi:hypothetical protein